MLIDNIEKESKMGNPQPVRSQGTTTVIYLEKWFKFGFSISVVCPTLRANAQFHQH